MRSIGGTQALVRSERRRRGDPRAPLNLIAELTYRCPLQCPYCSNPLDFRERREGLDARPMGTRLRGGRGARRRPSRTHRRRAQHPHRPRRNPLPRHPRGSLSASRHRWPSAHDRTPRRPRGPWTPKRPGLDPGRRCGALGPHRRHAELRGEARDRAANGRARPLPDAQLRPSSPKSRGTSRADRARDRARCGPARARQHPVPRLGARAIAQR